MSNNITHAPLLNHWVTMIVLTIYFTRMKMRQVTLSSRYSYHFHPWRYPAIYQSKTRADRDKAIISSLIFFHNCFQRKQSFVIGNFTHFCSLMSYLNMTPLVPVLILVVVTDLHQKAGKSFNQNDIHELMLVPLLLTRMNFNLSLDE